MDDPIELPDGRLVCNAHGLVICGLCCVDYSFMDEVLGDSGESEEEYEFPGEEPVSLMRPRVRGSGRILPTMFEPPTTSSKADEIFPPGRSTRAIPTVTRFIHRDDPTSFLIFTDGACLNNGQSDPKAGWAFVFKPETPATDNRPGIISARLENQGPFGDEHAQTSNRAELRAVLGALRFRAWHGEGCKTLVFATDSEYVAKGATEWMSGWLRKGWKTSTGAAVKNRDLWELLLGETERYDKQGLRIQFWRIPRAMNVRADRAAKQAAEDKEDAKEYQEILGMLT